MILRVGNCRYFSIESIVNLAEENKEDVFLCLENGLAQVING